MKIISEQQLDDANSVFMKAGIKGGSIFFLGSAAAVLLFSKYSPKAQYLRTPTKAFIISSLTTAGFVVYGERALVKYDRETHAHLTPGGIKVDKKIEIPTSPVQNFQNFVAEYRYHILGISWLLGMSGAGFYLYRKKYLTFSQKLVEARMYAQGITLASLGAVAAISANASKSDLYKK